MKTNTRIDALVPWSGDFYLQSAMYDPLCKWASCFTKHLQWPSLNDYQQFMESLPNPLKTLNGATIKIASQAGKPQQFSDHYAPRIFYSGEIQTRTKNWHDFFQMLTWVIYPKTKAVINQIHIPLAKQRIDSGGDIGRRTPVENTLSLFDEGGVVILSSDNSLLDHIRYFQWKQLFWERRNELQQKLRCITFGHAMYEKGLKPYVGMTANAILLFAQQEVIEMEQEAQLTWVDDTLAEIFQKGEQYQKPKDLSPFPILGMPGWVEENSDESYYDNQYYFRLGRTR